MNKYKNYWYEVKQFGDSIMFYFYDTEDRKNKAWSFNAEFYNFKQCLATIGNSAGKN